MEKEEELSKIQKPNSLALGFILARRAIGDHITAPIAYNSLLSAIILAGAYNNYKALKNNPKVKDLTFKEYFNTFVYSNNQVSLEELYLKRQGVLDGIDSYSEKIGTNLAYIFQDLFIRNPLDTDYDGHVAQLFKLDFFSSKAAESLQDDFRGEILEDILYPELESIQEESSNFRIENREGSSSKTTYKEYYNTKINDSINSFILNTITKVNNLSDFSYSEIVALNLNNDSSLKNDILNIGNDFPPFGQNKNQYAQDIDSSDELYNLLKGLMRNEEGFSEIPINLANSVTSNSSVRENFSSFSEGITSPSLIDISIT